MKLFCTFVFVLLFGFSILTHVAAIDCKRPSVGRYIVGKDGFDCISLLKESCSGMKTKNTRLWHRGVNVKDNCSKIRSMSAIATFMGPNNKYGGHAAIFSSCDANGIWVYDQWNGSRGVRYRHLTWAAGADRYFTVVV